MKRRYQRRRAFSVPGPYRDMPKTFGDYPLVSGSTTKKVTRTTGNNKQKPATPQKIGSKPTTQWRPTSTQLKMARDTVVAATATFAAKKFADQVATSPMETDTKGTPIKAPVTEDKKKRRKTTGGGGGAVPLHPGTFYSHTITMGPGPARAISMVSKINGTRKTVIDNTKKTLSIANRNNQHLEFGFNQRLFVQLPMGKPSTVGGMYDLVTNTSDGSAPTTPVRSQGRNYVSVLSKYVKYEIHNSNTFHNMHVKFHVIGVKKQNVSVNEMFAELFNATLGTQTADRLPIYRQLSVNTANDADTASQMNRVLLDPKKGTPFTLPYFKNNFFIAKTIKCKLAPNDTYELNLHTKFRSGIETFALRDRRSDAVANRNTLPLDYFVIAEMRGVECEGIAVSTSSTSPHLGTSPGWAFFEYESGYEFVNSARTEVDVPGSEDDEIIHARYYRVEGDRTLARLFNVNVANIVADAASTTNGDMYIPVVSDKLSTTEFPKAQRKDT